MTCNTSAVAVCCSKASRLGQQTRILDGDDGLRGEIFEKRDLRVRERPHLLSIASYQAEERPVFAQR
jgi:hypothetical protein